jgi:hypothetical protein
MPRTSLDEARSMTTAHLDNAARALRAILSAREPEYVWTVEVRTVDPADRPSPAHGRIDPGGQSPEWIGDPDGWAEAAGGEATNRYEHP